MKNSTRVVPRVDENLLDFLSYYELISKPFYSMTEVLYPTIKDINAWRTVVTIIGVAKTKLSHTNNRVRNTRAELRFPTTCYRLIRLIAKPAAFLL